MMHYTNPPSSVQHVHPGAKEGEFYGIWARKDEVLEKVGPKAALEEVEAELRQFPAEPHDELATTEVVNEQQYWIKEVRLQIRNRCALSRVSYEDLERIFDAVLEEQRQDRAQSNAASTHEH